MPLFTVRLEVDDHPIEIGYRSPSECLCDGGLRALFDGGHISACSIYCGDKRIAGLPLMDWARLRDQVISNSTTILRKGETDA